MKKHRTAHDKIRSWLKSGKSITGGLAWRKFSVYRLSSIINRLRHQEHMDIKTEMMFEGKDYSFARYFIPKK